VDLQVEGLQPVRAGQDPEKRKQLTCVDIEFLDGEHAGLHDNVPATRLHGPWSTVTQYDELMANWQRLGRSDLDGT
jgi:hypothetical protein